MAIPDFQAIMLPLLKFIEDKEEHSTRETIDYISSLFNLTEEEKKEVLPSGKQPIIDNRVGWARTYLKKAGLLENPQRGIIKISELGLKILEQNPAEINKEFLEQFDDFKEFMTIKREGNDEEIQQLEVTTEQTPQEAIEYGFQKINKNLAQEILQLIMKCSPKFFEGIVVDLLLKMGYGGSRKDAGKSIGQTGDGGIDGIIKEDKLGLDIIYIQAKRWENTVGRPEIQRFAGALQGHRANKGIFITTGSFSKEARDYANSINTKIILIDGEILTRLMIEYNVGVSAIETYEVKKIDSDYFIEE